MTRSSTQELFTLYEELKRVLHSTRRLFEKTSLDFSSLPEFDLFSDLEDQFEEEVAEKIGELTMEEYITITQKDYDSGINKKGRIELKGLVLLELPDNEFSNPRDDSLIEENKIAQIFRINTDIFHFETPLCEAFKEFNYLSQINVDVHIKDVHGFRTYEEYKDDWIYEWNDGIPWVNENPWTDDGEDNNCNTRDLPGFIREGNLIRYEDYKWYATLEDSELKGKRGWFDKHELIGDNDDDIGDLEDYLIQKDPPYYINEEEEERSKERRCKLLGIP
uniref:Uncharacterized protein n=1 Tax=Tanacetum cinerariifolium TaxID=118510 RepID=A0A6L2M4I6_TANCI|nr:hypothetical protein [Tanacetum cinerariifolium]